MWHETRGRVWTDGQLLGFRLRLEVARLDDGEIAMGKYWNNCRRSKDRVNTENEVHH